MTDPTQNLQNPDPGYRQGFIDGMATAREAVERQTDLADLMHFDKPSDFRKGVLTSLVAIDAAMKRASTTRTDGVHHASE